MLATNSVVCLYKVHRCQHQRTEKRDRADEKAGVRVFFAARGATGTVDDTQILHEVR